MKLKHFFSWLAIASIIQPILIFGQPLPPDVLDDITEIDDTLENEIADVDDFADMLEDGYVPNQVAGPITTSELTPSIIGTGDASYDAAVEIDSDIGALDTNEGNESFEGDMGMFSDVEQSTTGEEERSERTS